jgi:hypothetical protein
MAFLAKGSKPVNDRQKESVCPQLRERISLRYEGRWALLRRWTDLARVRLVGVYTTNGRRASRAPGLTTWMPALRPRIAPGR